MPRFVALSAVVVILHFLCAVQGQSCSGSSYTVQSGDTLSDIASSKGTTVAAIQSENPSITDPNMIQVGQTICIPGSGGDSGNSGTTGSSSGGSYSGSGSATYYYDVKTSCPQDPNGYPETNGYPACASYTAGPNQQTLAQLGSNNVVAIDMDYLKANRDSLCGKAITVMKDGQTVSPPDGGSFFVWDGCAACVGGGRIDFSVSGARNVDPAVCDKGVVPGVTWEVSDTQIVQFVA